MNFILERIKAKKNEKRMREIQEINENIIMFNKENDNYGTLKYKIVFKDEDVKEKKKEGRKNGK